MKHRIRILPMKALAAACLLLGGMPLFLLPVRLFAGNEALPWLALPVFVWLWTLGGYLLPARGRLPFSLLGCGLLAAWGILFQAPADPLRLLPLIPCMAALLALPPAWGRPVWDEWAPGAWIGGLVTHLFGLFVSVWPMFQGVQPRLLPCFAAYAFLYVLYLNRHGLADGMHGAARAPAAIRRRNTALSAVFFLVALAAACWGQLAEWVGAAWNFIRRAVAAAIDFFMRLLPEQKGGGPGGGGGSMDDMLGGLEEGEPGLLAIILEKVFQVIALILLLILLALAAKALYSACRRLWKRLMETLRRYAADAGEDYIDEAESTVNWDERTQTIRDRVAGVFRREKPERWESLSGRDRVRYLYRQYLRRRPEARRKTAREALAQDKGYSQSQARAFTDLYEQARYSEKEISPEQADALRKKIKA